MVNEPESQLLLLCSIAMALMSYSFLLSSEQEVEPAVVRQLLALKSALIQGIDLLLKVPSFTRTPSDCETTAGMLHAWSHER